jgi:hypothetical protein
MVSGVVVVDIDGVVVVDIDLAWFSQTPAYE